MNILGIPFYEFVLLIFLFVLSAVVISDHIRLSWWMNNGCSASDDEKKNNGPTEWAFYLAIVYIALASLYILYKLYKLIYPNRPKTIMPIQPMDFGKFKY